MARAARTTVGLPSTLAFKGENTACHASLIVGRSFKRWCHLTKNMSDNQNKQGRILIAGDINLKRNAAQVSF